MLNLKFQHKFDKVKLDDKDAETFEKKSYVTIGFLLLFYSLSTAVAIPVFPELTRRISDGDEKLAGLLYGGALFIRYTVEFFCGPVIGTITDFRGRKPILLLSFAVVAAEFLLLLCFPQFYVLLLSRAMSGVGDSGISTAYTIVTDLAHHNRDDLTERFGKLSAVFSFCFVVGLPLGGVMTDIDYRLCLLVAAALAVVGGVLTFFLLEESLDYNTQSRQSSMQLDSSEPSISIEDRYRPSYRTALSKLMEEANPLPAIRVHFSHKKLRKLSFAFIASTFALSGVSGIWFLYMDEKFDASATEIGLILSFFSLTDFLVQGFLLKVIVPGMWSESQACVYGLLLWAVETALLSVCPVANGFYVIAVLTFPCSVVDPVLKGLMVRVSEQGGEKYQGNLQGTLGSLRTFAQGMGAVIFSSIFSLTFNTVPFISLPFACAALVYLLCCVYLLFLFQSAEWADFEWMTSEVKDASGHGSDCDSALAEDYETPFTRGHPLSDSRSVDKDAIPCRSTLDCDSPLAIPNSDTALLFQEGLNELGRALLLSRDGLEDRS